MAVTSVLDNAADIYRPFTTAESARLGDFVDEVRKLADMKFFAEIPTTGTISFDNNGVTSEMLEPADEALRAAMTRFRQVYLANEPHSFSKTIALLKRSVHERGSARRDDAITDLDELREASRRALNGGGMAIVFEDAVTGESTPVPPSTIIDVYLHGLYMHSGNEKTVIAEQLDEIPVLSRFTLYTAMLALRNVYWYAANAVDRVLAVESLVT